MFGCRCRCIELAELIRVKRAAGRPKDFEAIAELEKLLELRSGRRAPVQARRSQRARAQRKTSAPASMAAAKAVCVAPTGMSPRNDTA